MVNRGYILDLKCIYVYFLFTVLLFSEQDEINKKFL